MPQLANHKIDNEAFRCVNFVEKENFLNIDFKDIACETRRDPIISKVCHAVMHNSLQDLKDDKYIPYCNITNELTVDHDCLLWGK